MFSQALLVVFTALVASVPSFAETLNATAINAIRDEDGDGTGDVLTPQSANYVYNEYNREREDKPGESRTFAKFTIPTNLAPFSRATLTFTAFRYNSPHVPPQRLSVYGFQGDGAVQLADWAAPAALLGTTAPIAGYTADRRGEAILSEFDVTAALLEATKSGARHFSISVRNCVRSAVDNRDPLGYSALVTVGNFRINTQAGTAQAPDTPSDR